jgi:hypothetical protein
MTDPASCKVQAIPLLDKHTSCAFGAQIRTKPTETRMKATCPKGCIQTERWSDALQTFIQDSFCNNCGSEMEIFDPEAERDWEEFIERRKKREYAMVKGIFIAFATMILLWVLS